METEERTMPFTYQELRKTYNGLKSAHDPGIIMEVLHYAYPCTCCGMYLGDHSEFQCRRAHSGPNDEYYNEDLLCTVWFPEGSFRDADEVIADLRIQGVWENVNDD